MDWNELSNLEINTFFGTRNLQVLSMVNNRLEKIMDGTFRWTQSLEYLNVARNALTHIDISMIPSLKHANVSFNQLRKLTIPSEIEILDASHNHILTVPNGTNTYLTKLNLSFNGITGTAWLHQFPLLKELDLSYNELEAITFRDLRTIHNIEKLLLSNNRLMVLNLREPIQSLRVLDVSHNGLVHVENNQKQFETLKQLYLNHNSLVTLRIGRNNTLEKLMLSNNDWDCNNIRSVILRRRAARGCCNVPMIAAALLVHLQTL
uniref:Leucine rich immune protein (Coil-less) n=1 Tax=Anopheles dirus TaxID=7168 RepID=A0A182NJM2_9DIPT